MLKVKYIRTLDYYIKKGLDFIDKVKKLRGTGIITLVICLIFVMASLSASAVSAPHSTCKVDSDNGAFIRQKASSSSAVVMGVKNNTKLTILSELFTKNASKKSKHKWYYVSVSGKKGYIRSDLVDTVKNKTVNATTTDSLNYRTTPCVEGERVGTFNKGSKVNVVLESKVFGNSDKWYKVKVGSKYYYAMSKYISLNSSPGKSSASKPETDSTPTTNNVSVSTNNISYPELIGQGSAFVLKGTISCNKDISKVLIGIKNSNGKWVTSATRNLSKTENPRVFDIASIDREIQFGTLVPGKYTYLIYVYVEGKRYRKGNYSFTVKKLNGYGLLSSTALSLVWPKGSYAWQYSKLLGGKATTEYSEALKIAFNGKSVAAGGASCDVFVSTVCRYSGYDRSVPASVSSQWNYFANSSKWKKVE